MAEINITQIETPDEIDAVRTLVREFFEFAMTQDPDAGKAHAFEGLEDQLAALPGIFAPPIGGFLLVTVDEAPAGCVGFFGHDATTCEVKRMYVRPGFRGLRLGDHLIAELLSRARAQGYSKIILDTFHTLKAAQRLYEKAGFRYVPPRIDLPPNYEGKIVFMEMELR